MRFQYPLGRFITHIVILSLLFQSAGAQQPSAKPKNDVAHRKSFTVDPNWDALRNRLLPKKRPRVIQHFGYRDSHHAGGSQAGEIGGTIQRSSQSATYAKEIQPKTLNDQLTASGRFAVTQASGSSGVMFGWFNKNSRGWRTPNSLGFRIDGNGGKYWLFYEYGTQKFRTAGGGAYEGERYQLTKTPPFPADGSSHQWSMQYRPNAKRQPGMLTFQIDDRRYTLEVSPEHKADGATFDRFGIWNVQVGGKSMDVFFDDLVVDGKRETFARDPGWIGVGNEADVAERIVRPFHDFGYSNSHHAGGEQGEIGGIIFRDEAPAYYADAVPSLSLDDELHASGRVALLQAGSDSAICIGWFDAKSKRDKKTPEHEKRHRNSLSIMIEGPSRVGHYFRPGYSTSLGQGHAPTTDPSTGKERPIIAPDGKPHQWSLHYSPAGANGNGRITFSLDGETQSLNLKPGAREEGATLDRFGLFNVQSGGHHVEIYLDDLQYTAGPASPSRK